MADCFQEKGLDEIATPLYRIGTFGSDQQVANTLKSLEQYKST